MTGAIRACGPNTGSDCCSAPLQNNLHAPVVHGRMCAQCIWCRFVCMLLMMAEHVQTDFPSLLYLPADRVCPPTFSPILPTLTFLLHLNLYQYYTSGACLGASTHPRRCRTVSTGRARLPAGRRARSATTSNVLDACVCALVCVCTSRKSMACGVSAHGRRAWSRGPE